MTKGRTKKEKSARKLFLKAERLWKEICFLRDGPMCQVKKNFGSDFTHTDILMVDHCFSRTNHHLFFEPSNGTVVCGSCNMQKEFNKSVDLAIDKIVIDREGLEKFNEMEMINRRKEPNHEWGKIHWLEYIVEKLEAQVKPLRPQVFGGKA